MHYLWSPTILYICAQAHVLTYVPPHPKCFKLCQLIRKSLLTDTKHLANLTEAPWELMTIQRVWVIRVDGLALLHKLMNVSSSFMFPSIFSFLENKFLVGKKEAANVLAWKKKSFSQIWGEIILFINITSRLSVGCKRVRHSQRRCRNPHPKPSDFCSSLRAGPAGAVISQPDVPGSCDASWRTWSLFWEHPSDDNKRFHLGFNWTPVLLSMEMCHGSCATSQQEIPTKLWWDWLPGEGKGAVP